jgi:hypothetical protein
MHEVFSRAANLKRNNSIKWLLVNGLVSSDKPAIIDRIVQFYESLFCITI